MYRSRKEEKRDLTWHGYSCHVIDAHATRAAWPLGTLSMRAINLKVKLSFAYYMRYYYHYHESATERMKEKH